MNLHQNYRKYENPDKYSEEEQYLGATRYSGVDLKKKTKEEIEPASAGFLKI